MPQRRLLLVGVASLSVAAWVVACRDFGRFEPLPADGGTGGEGGSVGDGAGGDAGAGGIGTGGDGGTGGGTTLPCGLIDGLADDFEAQSIDSDKWHADAFDGADLYVDGGALVFAFDSDYSAASFYSHFDFDARGRALTFDLEEVTLTSGNALYFSLGPDGDNYVELAFNGDSMQFFVEIEDNYNPVASAVTFDRTLHRYVRFREDAGTIHYETSGDAVAWADVYSVSTDALGGWANIGLYIGGDGDGSGVSSQVKVGGILGEGPSPLCAADTFTEDFEGGEIGTAWGYGWEYATCNFSVTGGRLLAHAEASSQGEDCAIGTGRAFDLTGASVTLEMVTPDATVGYVFGVYDAERENFAMWDLDESALFLTVVENQNWIDVETTTYDPVTMRFMRIREESGKLYWESSQDGQTFSSVAEWQTAGIDLSAVRIAFAMYTSQTNTTEHTVVVDNVNILP